MVELYWKIRRFFTEGLWSIRSDSRSFLRRTLLKYLKILVLALQGFNRDQAGLRASALTLYSLLSIVPVLALLFGIAKGFGLETRFDAWLLSHFPEQQDVLKQAVEFARRALDNAQGGLVAGAGVVFLIYSVIKVIGNIEQAMNHIWSIAKSRSWTRKFSDYLSVILIGPFLVLGASSLNVYVATWIKSAAEAAPYSRFLGPVAATILQFLPLLLLWGLFSFLYIFLPNAKVKPFSGLFGGAIAALVYQLAQSLYIRLQVGVSQTNAIYGSFAALPLFIIWLQISWNIVLMGAEITQQHQNFRGNELRQHVPNLSFLAIKRIGLALCGRICERFGKGELPATAEQLGADLDIPIRIVRQMLEKLTAARLILETDPWDGSEAAYVPARDPRLLTPAAIIKALEMLGEDLEESGAGLAENPYTAVLDEMDRCMQNVTPVPPSDAGKGDGNLRARTPRRVWAWFSW
ncbi:MAG: YihY/virulence factor BrkB family protein [Fibrobacteres bacterium]|nr:YihY/virulence factor BrkB family protein [Fibrobacterota bacterium]